MAAKRATVAHYTRNVLSENVLSEAPEIATTIRGEVNGKASETDVGTHVEAVLLGIKYHDNGPLGIADFV